MPRRRKHNKRSEYLPTQNEILAGCARIQATWSEVTRQVRAGTRARPVEIQVMKMHTNWQDTRDRGCDLD